MPRTCPKHSCQSCPVRATTEWADLGAEELALLDRHKIERRYGPGDTLYHQGAPNMGVHCIHSGLVGLRRLDADGNSVLVRLARPGETVGYRSFLRKSAHSLSAEVLAPSHICTIDRSAITTLLAKKADLGFRFLQHGLDDMEEIEERLIQCRTWPARARLLHTLLVFNEREGTRTQSGAHAVDLPVTRRELASIVGTTPEAMSRLVRQVQSDGLVQFEGRHVVIPDIDQVLNSLPMLG